MKTYTLHRFGLFSLLKFGFVTGLVASFPVISFMVISAWRTAINFWDWLVNFEIVIPLRLLLADEISISALEMLRGWPPIETLEAIAGQNWLQIILYILILTFLAGVWTALVGFFSGLAFNLLAWLTGGLQLKMSGGDDQPVQMSSPSPHPMKAFPGSQGPIQSPPARQALSSVPPSGPYLEIIAPVQQIVPITAVNTLIGSGPECAISLDDLQPRHAQLSYEEGRYLLRDFSQGKTLVQGHIVEGINMIKDGFQIQLGHYHMIFRYGV
jgi:hypothetical protein